MSVDEIWESPSLNTCNQPPGMVKSLSTNFHCSLRQTPIAIQQHRGQEVYARMTFLILPGYVGKWANAVLPANNPHKLIQCNKGSPENRKPWWKTPGEGRRETMLSHIHSFSDYGPWRLTSWIHLCEDHWGTEVMVTVHGFTEHLLCASIVLDTGTQQWTQKTTISLVRLMFYWEEKDRNKNVTIKPHGVLQGEIIEWGKVRNPEELTSIVELIPLVTMVQWWLFSFFFFLSSQKELLWERGREVSTFSWKIN